MKCQVCHADTSASDAFCPQCGAKLRENEAAHAPPGASGPAAALTARRTSSDVPEEPLWEGGFSPRAMLGSLLAGVLASVVLIVLAPYLGPLFLLPLAAVAIIWLVMAVRLETKWLGVRYRLTNQMFYHQRGVLRRVTNRVEVIDIDDVSYEQGLLDRLVNVGKIRIRSSDRTDPELVVEGISDVQAVAQMIDKARRAERIRRGVSVEAV